MLLKRYIPIGIVAFFGSLTLFGWFIENESIESFVNDDATQWYDIIASFAIFLGALNLLKLQFLKVVKRQSGWQYSVVAIASFFFAFTIGFFMKGAFFVGEDVYFTQKAAEQAILVSGSSEAVRAVEWGAHISTEGGLFKWMFDNIFTNQVSQESYPPFNIEKIDEENYRISIASAGFSQEDFLIEVENPQLTVGVRASKREEQTS